MAALKNDFLIKALTELLICGYCSMAVVKPTTDEVTGLMEDNRKAEKGTSKDLLLDFCQTVAEAHSIVPVPHFVRFNGTEKVWQGGFYHGTCADENRYDRDSEIAQEFLDNLPF